jgi:hypothetical protein
MYCLPFHSPGAAKQLVQELRSRFPAHQLMDALGMVYPQYWCIEDCRTNFEKHIQVVKAHYCLPKSTHGRKTKVVQKRTKKGTGSATGVEVGEVDIGAASAALVIQVSM